MDDRPRQHHIIAVFTVDDGRIARLTQAREKRLRTSHGRAYIASMICPVSISSSAANSLENAISLVSSHFGRAGLLGVKYPLGVGFFAGSVSANSKQRRAGRSSVP